MESAASEAGLQEVSVKSERSADVHVKIEPSDAYVQDKLPIECVKAEESQHACVKVEYSSLDVCVKDEAMCPELDYVVKEELELGPEVVQPRRELSAVPGQIQNKLSVKSETNQYSRYSYRAAKKASLCHEKKHTDESLFHCDHCDYTANDIQSVIKHLRTQHARKYELEIHENNHTSDEDEMLKCGQCSFVTTYKSSLRVHQRIHTGVKPYKCNQCSYTSAHKQSLKLHIRKHHFEEVEKTHKCGLCSYASVRKRDLKIHESNHTGDEVYMLYKQYQQYKCGQCSYATAYKNNLIVHQRGHTGAKPYKCDQCSYTSAHKQSLNVHIRKHIFKKSHKCGQCDFSSAYSGNLRRHQEIHTGAKQYNCGQCSYSTNQQNCISVHERSHTDDKSGRGISGAAEPSTPAGACGTALDSRVAAPIKPEEKTISKLVTYPGPEADLILKRLGIK